LPSTQERLIEKIQAVCFSQDRFSLFLRLSINGK
jgi:hypothetical protein